MKHRAHLFFPENDIALANNLVNYTPPRAATLLHTAGETLPMWYGEAGDVFLSQGVNARWYSIINETFRLDVDVFSANPENFIPMPWGWSRASRQTFERFGFDKSMLPTDESVERMRMLSHRRSSVAIYRAIADEFDGGIALCPGPMEAFTREQTLDIINSFGGNCVIKMPWSNAGRGLFYTSLLVGKARCERIDDIIEAYGSIMVEKAFERIIDFAMLFDARCDGRVKFCGLSMFQTEEHGAYTANIVADDEILLSRLHRYINISDTYKLARLIETTLEKLIDGNYVGRLGIDMLIAKDENTGCYMLDPIVELNLRMTMGHVAHSLASKVLAKGVEGKFETIINKHLRQPTDLYNPLEDVKITDHKLTSGTLVLNPPTSHFLFLLTAQ